MIEYIIAGAVTGAATQMLGKGREFLIRLPRIRKDDDGVIHADLGFIGGIIAGAVMGYLVFLAGGWPDFKILRTEAGIIVAALAGLIGPAGLELIKRRLESGIANGLPSNNRAAQAPPPPPANTKKPAQIQITKKFAPKQTHGPTTGLGVQVPGLNQG